MAQSQGILNALRSTAAFPRRVQLPPPQHHGFIRFPGKELQPLSLSHVRLPTRHSSKQIREASLMARSHGTLNALLSTVAFHHAVRLPPPQHQVFISFRGKELRHGFVSHLVDALKRKGINFFIDEHEQRGKDLKNLFVRIEESKIALTIFSERYAESNWCLDELAKINERVGNGALHVIPVFYKVEPYHVKNQTGDFGDRFLELAKNHKCSRIKKWKKSLKSVSNKMGMVLENNRSECHFISDIVKEIEKSLMGINPYA